MTNKTQEALDRQFRINKTITDNAASCLFMMDKEGYPTFMNPAAEKVTGYILDEIRDMPLHDAIHHHYPDGRPYPMCDCPIDNAQAELVKMEDYEDIFIRKDGSFFPVICYIAPLEENGKVVGSVLEFRDVTLQKEAENALDRQFRINKTITDNAASCLFMMDKEGYPTFMNPAAEKVTGYILDEIRDMPLHDAIHHHYPDGRPYPMCDCPIDNAQAELVKMEDYEDIFIRKDGGFFPVICYIAPLEENGKVVGSVLEFRDVTEQKEAEKEIRVLNTSLEQRVVERTEDLARTNEALQNEITERKKMEEALLQSEKLKSLGIITAGISHEFNNILAVMIGNAELLGRGFKDDKELKKRLNCIIKAGNDGAEIVKNMMKFAKSKGKDTYDYIFLDIRYLINDVIDFAAPRWKNMAQAKGIDYKIDIEGMREVPKVLCNTTELREVLTNIINNALDAMPDGGSLSLSTWSNEDTVFISISDTGKGMSEDVKEKIFDPFFTTRRPLGTGLGMSISYSVIVKHGGSIEVESEEGKGTTVNLSIPIGKDVVQKTVPPEPARQITTKKLYILVVDDNVELCEIIDGVLTSGGHTVKTLNNGFEAIELAGKEDFDLVLCDLAMPDINGYEVAKAINKLERRPKIGIITGWRERIELFDEEDTKVDFILRKPFKHAGLAKQINRLFGTDSKL